MLFFLYFLQHPFGLNYLDNPMKEQMSGRLILLVICFRSCT